MKIYALKKYGTFEDYAQFIATGTWSDGILCPGCGRSTEILISPLQVEWESGTDLIGDFSWGQFSLCIVRHRVFRFLKDQGFECDFKKVEYIEPTERLRKREKRVPYPYTGNKLRWLHTTSILKCDFQRTGIEYITTCMVCKMSKLTYKQEGIIINADQYNGEKMFCIMPSGNITRPMVSEEGRALIEEAGFTNVAFKECGMIE